MATKVRVNNTANWEVANFQDVPADLAGYDFVVAQLLLQRGITDKQAAERFLRPSLDQLADPYLLPDFEKAIERIKQAIAGKEWIVVYGDYDVDGVTSSTILISVIKKLGGHATVYLPERMKEGYGLNIPALDQLKSEGADLIVAVDNGTAAYDQIAHANSIGLDVVVVDHHEPHGHIPEAVAVVNPKLEHSEYPFRECCAAGVSYHVARALVGDEAAREYLDLAAVGTVADVVPLVSDNRVLVVEGLKVLNKTQRFGLQALIEVAGLMGKEIEAYHLGFQLGPRLNAAGRIDHASLAFDLMNAGDYSTALQKAKQLNDLNTRRQEMTDGMLVAAKAAAAKMGEEKILVVGAADWSIGVAGIVAGRLVEAFSKPAIVFEYQETHAKGSGRSVDGVHIVDLLNEVADELDHYGGHAKAAGLSVARERFESFRTHLQQVAREKIEASLLRPRVSIAIALEPAHVTSTLVENIERFAPFGFGNSTPVLAMMGLSYVRCEPFGAGARFGKLLMTSGDKTVELVVWDGWEELIFDMEQGKKYDVAFTASTTQWKDRRFLELKLVAIRDAE